MILPKYLDTIEITGVLPGTHQDVNNLLPGDTVYFCDKCKNRKKKIFLVLIGVVKSFDATTRVYEVSFNVKFRKKKYSEPWSKILFSNEVGDTPEMAVNNMLRLPWEQYS